MNNSEGNVDEVNLLVKAQSLHSLKAHIQKLVPKDHQGHLPERKDRGSCSRRLQKRSIRGPQGDEPRRAQHQIEKMLQMWELINPRSGVVFTGQSGCGKTTLWTLLQRVCEKLNIKVEIEVMKPKSLPRQRLLGRVDYDAREWFYGVLTRAASRAVASSYGIWIVSAGDIDPEWIESLNSVIER